MFTVMITLLIVFFVIVILTVGVFFGSSLMTHDWYKNWFKKIKREMYINKRIRDLAFDPGLVCDMLRREDPEFDKALNDIIDSATGERSIKRHK